MSASKAASFLCGLFCFLSTVCATFDVHAGITFSPASPDANSDIYATSSHPQGLTNIELRWSGPTSGNAGCASGRMCGNYFNGEHHWEHHLGRLPVGTYQIEFRADQCGGVCERATLTVGSPCQSQPESCDGKDNDCNGQIDEGLERNCYSGPVGTEGKGPCKAGKQICIGGTFGKCQGEVTPSSEICNDKIDNDCNGKVDETCECQAGQKKICYSGPPNTANVGTCRSGEQTCENGGWTACTGEILPQQNELCGDGKDNNCDGQVDEGCQCKPNETRECYSGPPNTRYVGVCKPGKQTCSPQGQWSACEHEKTPEAKEICGDGLDNDCNGQLDNGCFPSPEPSSEFGSPENATDGASEHTANHESITLDPDASATSDDTYCPQKRVLQCNANKSSCSLVCPRSRATGCSCFSSAPTSFSLGWLVFFLGWIFLLRPRSKDVV